MVLLKTEDLTFSYPNCEVNSLKNVNIEINKGEFVLLMGRTGSGKSTLLKLFNKHIAPVGDCRGNITVNSNSIAYVSQNPELTFVCESVRGELAFALENKCMKNDEIALRLGEIASFFNLNDLLDEKINNLSGGEKSTVALAGAMIDNCDTLILDEPVSQLDTKASFDFINLLKRVNSELGVTVIMASHISDGIIDSADRLIVLDDGEVIFNDNPNNPNDDVLDLYPLSSRLFDSHPLTVKDAQRQEKRFKEKPVIKAEKTGRIAELKNITFSYEKGGADILDGLSFVAYENKIHSIIGANGSGKTTLLKVIAGIKKAYSGRVKINGKIAYMPQNPQYLFTKDTVLEEISLDTAKRFGLESLMTHHPYDLSGGQMQKLALAILSEAEFDILLLDEPTKALDTYSKNELKAYLRGLNKTVIIVSHDLDFVGEISDYVSFLSDGIIVISGERREVLSGLNYYTTQLRRITRSYLNNAVSLEDVE